MTIFELPEPLRFAIEKKKAQLPRFSPAKLPIKVDLPFTFPGHSDEGHNVQSIAIGTLDILELQSVYDLCALYCITCMDRTNLGPNEKNTTPFVLRFKKK